MKIAGKHNKMSRDVILNGTRVIKVKYEGISSEIRENTYDGAIMLYSYGNETTHHATVIYFYALDRSIRYDLFISDNYSNRL